MKRNVALTIASSLSILLLTLHLADDAARGWFPGTLPMNLAAILITVFLIYGTLALAERRSGHVITLLVGLTAVSMPVLHMQGKGVGGEFGKSGGAFFFIWTLLALGVAGSFSVILSVRGLWSLRKGQQT
jgi:hypothetical protein